MANDSHNLHSREQFGKQRDFWWNPDFLSLMASRWRLEEVNSFADIGCGVGHWSRLLYQFMGNSTELLGIDLEDAWAKEAEQRFFLSYPAASRQRVTFRVGDALAIPSESNHFDLVTCQTLLMHLESPQQAIKEMIRIARPGGLIVCVEPNNFINTIYMSSLTESLPVEAQVRRYEFWLRYHVGRISNGLGNDAIGELVPGFFADSGLEDIKVYQSDRAAPYFPPYDTEEQRTLLSQEAAWRTKGESKWNLSEVSQYVIAGGGKQEFVDLAWAEMMAQSQLKSEWVEKRKLTTAGGGLNYLVSGRKSK